MANVITDEMIDYIGILSKLDLSEKEREQAKSDMCKMLDYFDTMNELDTSDVEPLSHVFNTQNVFRNDELANSSECINMQNAPVVQNNMFVVPRTL